MIVNRKNYSYDPDCAQLATLAIFGTTEAARGHYSRDIQNAKAWAACVYDRIEWNNWTLTPGLELTFSTWFDAGAKFDF